MSAPGTQRTGCVTIMSAVSEERALLTAFSVNQRGAGQSGFQPDLVKRQNW